MIQQPPVHWEHERLILVVLHKLQRRQIGQSPQCGARAGAGRASSPARSASSRTRTWCASTEPRLAAQEVLAEELLDALALPLLAGSEEGLHHLFLRLLAEAELAVRDKLFATIMGDAVERVVRVVLVEPVKRLFVIKRVTRGLFGVAI